MWVCQVWLSALSTEMKNTLKHLLCECVNAGKKGNVDPTRFPTQVTHTHTKHVSSETPMSLCGSSEVTVEWLCFQILCLAEQIQFTADVENAIRQQNLHQLELELTAKLESYTSVDTSMDDTAGTPTPDCVCDFKLYHSNIYNTFNICCYLCIF